MEDRIHARGGARSCPWMTAFIRRRRTVMQREACGLALDERGHARGGERSCRWMTAPIPMDDRSPPRGGPGSCTWMTRVLQGRNVVMHVEERGHASEERGPSWGGPHSSAWVTALLRSHGPSAGIKDRAARSKDPVPRSGGPSSCRWRRGVLRSHDGALTGGTRTPFGEGRPSSTSRAAPLREERERRSVVRFPGSGLLGP